ncbi:MAG TPA: hypothetical protein RMI62_02610, partial [Polyangiaceae bacterium LLY-WYZ-15_(1-7)]|nr:hypothetical protein [Polyangiaceae bacterium LLY-WYZ-15_(1-7)]
MSAAGRGRLVAALTIGGALAFLFWPLLVGWAEGTPRWFEWDVPEQYWPDLVYLCEALHDGELPRWNPYDRAGYPFYADPQAGTHHPLNWAICAVAGPSPGVGWAHLRVVLGFAFAGLFGVLWLRRLELAWSGAIVGGVALMAAPFMRHNWELNLTSALGWMPLMLWAAEGVVRRRRVADGVALAFAAASCAWVGSPPALWQASTLTLLYGLGRAAMVLRAEDGRAEGSRAERVGLGAGTSAGAPDAGRQLDEARVRGGRAEGGAAKLRDDRDEGAARRRARLRALGGMAKAAGVAALLGAAWIGVVFVPGLELAEHSVQAGRSYEAIADKGLGAEALEALIAPRSGNHLYGGWLALAAVAVALWRRRGLA